MKTQAITMIDIKDPEYGVHIQVSRDRKRLWITVDGLCVCRIQGIGYSKDGLYIVDEGELDEN